MSIKRNDRFSIFIDQHRHAFKLVFRTEYCDLSFAKIIYEVYTDFYQYVKENHPLYINDHHIDMFDEKTYLNQHKVNEQFHIYPLDIIKETLKQEYVFKCFKKKIPDQVFYEFYVYLLNRRKKYKFIQPIMELFNYKTKKEIKQNVTVVKFKKKTKMKEEQIEENKLLPFFDVNSHITFKISERGIHKGMQALKVFCK